MVKESKIKLNEVDQVQEFVAAAGRCDFDIDIFYNEENRCCIPEKQYHKKKGGPFKF